MQIRRNTQCIYIILHSTCLVTMDQCQACFQSFIYGNSLTFSLYLYTYYIKIMSMLTSEAKFDDGLHTALAQTEMFDS